MNDLLEFSWICTECKKTNFDEVNEFNDNGEYTCSHCNEPHIIEVAVNINVYNIVSKRDYKAEEQRLETKANTIEVEVSIDKGKTWSLRLIDTRKITPETADIKLGEIVRKHGIDGKTRYYETSLNPEGNRLWLIECDDSYANVS